MSATSGRFPITCWERGSPARPARSTSTLAGRARCSPLPVVYLIYRSYYLYLGRMEDGRKHAEEMAVAASCEPSKRWRWPSKPRITPRTSICSGCKSTPSKSARIWVWTSRNWKLCAPPRLLHDIGKLAVPEHIISKPGKLTREEFEKMKIHPVVGAEILERVRFPYPVTPIVRSHHEKWNGSGYPDGLKGEDIPIGARILCGGGFSGCAGVGPAISAGPAAGRSHAEGGGRIRRQLRSESSRRPAAALCGTGSHGAGARRGNEAQALHRRQSRARPGAGGRIRKYQAARPAAPDKPSDFLSSIAAARQEVQTLFELAQDLGNSLSLNETLSLLAMRLKRMIPYDSLAIYVLRDDKLRAEYVNGENFRLFSSLEIPLGQGLSGWVAENRKPIINGNPSVEPGYLSDETKFTTMRSALSVPLIGLNGTVSVLTLYHTESDAFTKDHLRILLAIVPKVALSIENALKFQQAAKFRLHRLHDRPAQRPLAVPASG